MNGWKKKWSQLTRFDGTVNLFLTTMISFFLLDAHTFNYDKYFFIVIRSPAKPNISYLSPLKSLPFSLAFIYLCINAIIFSQYFCEILCLSSPWNLLFYYHVAKLSKRFKYFSLSCKIPPLFSNIYNNIVLYNFNIKILISV